MSEYKTTFQSLVVAKEKCLELKEGCSGITEENGILTLRRGINYTPKNNGKFGEIISFMKVPCLEFSNEEREVITVQECRKKEFVEGTCYREYLKRTFPVHMYNTLGMNYKGRDYCWDKDNRNKKKGCFQARVRKNINKM